MVGPNRMSAELHFDEKAMQVAERLCAVISRESTNRQCAAAQVSALFNLVYSLPPSVRDGSGGCTLGEPQLSSECGATRNSIPTVVTAQLAQDAISKHIKDEHGGTCRTLADGIKAMRKELPNNLSKQLLALNSAGSYDRHHGAAINRKLLGELDHALLALRLSGSVASAAGFSDPLRPRSATTNPSTTPSHMAATACRPPGSTCSSAENLAVATACPAELPLHTADVYDQEDRSRIRRAQALRKEDELRRVAALTKKREV
jgi:hypothetical protein